MARDKKEEPEEREEQPKPKKGLPVKWILIVAVAVLVVGAGAGAGYYFFAGKKDSAAATAKKPVAVTIWPMEAFIVNITDGNGERYLKLVVQLELSEPDAVAELEQIKPRLRDSILDLLAPKTLKELMDLAGKQRLREDIGGRVNNVLTRGKVTRVYFTEFVVQ
jgi:flagellar FliL protein